MDDWNILKSVVEKKSPVREDLGKPVSVERAYEVPKKLSGFTINKTDMMILKELIKNDSLTLKELEVGIKKSRISIYFSLKKLRDYELITKNRSEIMLRENRLVEILKKLVSEGFDFNYLLGKRRVVLTSLMEWKSPDEISSELAISISSAYKYLNQLMPLLKNSRNKYRVKSDKGAVIDLLKMINETGGVGKNFVEAWSSHGETLIKSNEPLDGAMTSFSRFTEFGINLGYINPPYYYLRPGRELLPEEILVHAIMSSENSDMLAQSISFFVINHKLIRPLLMEKLADRFDVMDIWMDIHSYVTNRGAIKNKDIFISNDEFRDKFGFEGSIPSKRDNRDYSGYSNESLFISKIISLDLGDVLDCEQLVLEKKLDWRTIKKIMIDDLRGSGKLPLEPIMLRLDAICRRNNVNIPLAKDMLRMIIEDKIKDLVKEKKTIKEIHQGLEIPEYQIRNILNKMSRNRKVKKLDTEPITYSSFIDLE